MDKFLTKLPGSNGTKVFIAATAIVGLSAYPIFGRTTEGTGVQGAAYLSQEKPEAIASATDRLRKQHRREKQAQRELQKQQQEQQQQQE